MTRLALFYESCDDKMSVLLCQVSYIHLDFTTPQNLEITPRDENKILF